jgi:broad specificity phosphatase PhoE
MRIVLARHGRPDFSQRSWIAPKDMRTWINDYDEALLVSGAPAAAQAIAASLAIIVSSTLPRSTQSAKCLAQGRAILTEDVFREVQLPHSLWGWPKLPASLWALVFRFSWFCGFSAGAESLQSARSRAAEAARRLMALARESGSVLLVGHGIMNMLIARQLLDCGAKGQKRPNSRYWQFTAYCVPPLASV